MNKKRVILITSSLIFLLMTRAVNAWTTAKCIVPDFDDMTVLNNITSEETFPSISITKNSLRFYNRASGALGGAYVYGNKKFPILNTVIEAYVTFKTQSANRSLGGIGWLSPVSPHDYVGFTQISWALQLDEQQAYLFMGSNVISAPVSIALNTPYRLRLQLGGSSTSTRVRGSVNGRVILDEVVDLPTFPAKMNPSFVANAYGPEPEIVVIRKVPECCREH